MKSLALLALDTAQSLGATYADVRFLTYRRQDLFTEDERVARLSDRRDTGFGIRVIAGGAWGFAVISTGVKYQATAVGEHDAKSRAYVPPPLTRGYENVDAADLLDQTERVAEDAVRHLYAKECPVGKKDLILDPHNLALTIHESVGHATELDRVLGYEESLAGRSFATPEKLNHLDYGSDLVTFRADNTLENGLATHGFDDDGVPG